MLKRVVLIVAVAVAIVAVQWILRAARTPSDLPAEKDTSTAESSAGPTLQGGDREPPETGNESPASVVAESDPTRQGVEVEGRVVDEQRRPVAGALIAVERPGVPLKTARSDAGGEFSLSLGPVPTAAFHMGLRVTEGRRAARLSIYMRPRMPRAFRLGTLVLRPTHELDVLVTADGTPVPRAQVVVTDKEDMTRSGRLAEGRTDAQGRLHVAGLTGARVRVFAHAQGRGRGLVEGDLPQVGAPLEVALPPDRALDVLVKHAVSGEPVPDAEVFVAAMGTTNVPMGWGCLPALLALRTDKQGRVRVAGLPAGHVSLVARAAGLAPLSQGWTWKGIAVKPEAAEAEVLLYPYRTLRFPIRASKAGVPAEGTSLEVVRYQATPGDEGIPITARIENEHVVIEPFPPGYDWGHVAAPDGRWAAFKTSALALGGKLEAVFFRPSRDVVVRLSSPDGQPLAGEWLWLIIRPRGRGEPRQTDVQGMVTWSRLQGEGASVMWSPKQRGSGTPVARVSLASPPGITEAVVRPPVRVRLAMTVDGEARLPLAYKVQVPDTDVQRPAGQLRSVSETELKEDAEAGEVSFRWLAPAGDGPLPVTIEAEGYSPTSVTLTLASDGVWRGTAALSRATLLIVRVVPPKGNRWHVMLERWDERSEGFSAHPGDASMHPKRGSSREVQRYDALSPGRYRLRELVTGHTSAPFEVGVGAGELEVPFDLTTIVLIKGKVLLPEGEDPAFAQVVVEGGPVSRQMPERPIYVAADGTFEHRALRGSRLRFKAIHPVLRPATEGGSQEVVVGQEAPTLRLEKGIEAVFQMDGSDFTTPAPDARIYGGPHFGGPVIVRAAPADRWTAETAAVHALARAGRFRIGIEDVGRWRLRIEVDGCVPIDLPPVEIKAGVNDLGTLRPSRGARLRLRLHATLTVIPQYAEVKAVRLGENPYACTSWKVEPGDPPSVVVAGLGAGRFHVTLSWREAAQGGGQALHLARPSW